MWWNHDPYNLCGRYKVFPTKKFNLPLIDGAVCSASLSILSIYLGRFPQFGG